MNDTELAPSMSHATLLRMALDALNTKALRWVVLLMSFALFGYASLQPHWIKLVAASAFALVFALPAFWRKGA
jgi:hypothetical protein